MLPHQMVSNQLFVNARFHKRTVVIKICGIVGLLIHTALYVLPLH